MEIRCKVCGQIKTGNICPNRCVEDMHNTSRYTWCRTKRNYIIKSLIDKNKQDYIINMRDNRYIPMEDVVDIKDIPQQLIIPGDLISSEHIRKSFNVESLTVMDVDYESKVILTFRGNIEFEEIDKIWTINRKDHYIKQWG